MCIYVVLPFLEYDLHRQLQHKLKIHGKNGTTRPIHMDLFRYRNTVWFAITRFVSM